MLKKAATQQTLKDLNEKLTVRLNKNVEELDKLMNNANIPQYTAVPDMNVLSNLLQECEDSAFWHNFKKAAPILFCSAIEQDQDLKQLRDMSFIEELLKTKSIMRLMKDKVARGDADVDIVEYSLATKTLETKLQVLQALNINVESSEDQNKITLNVHGSGKSIEIDLAKMREAITIHDKKVEEKEVVVSKASSAVENIDIENITEEEFLKLAVEKTVPVQKTANKTLTKESFIKIFKYTGDYAKIKSREVKQKAQERRAAEFGKDPKKYLEALKQTIQEEEQAYERSSSEMFDKLCITPEMFERSQQELMMDPYVSMELFNMGISMEQPSSKAPEELNYQKTVELVKDSNNFAFDLFKKEYLSQMRQDPMMMPVLISAIAHDWVFKNHGFTEDQFKAALFTHKIYEDPEVAMHMQTKQMELLSLSGGFDPMMMGMGGMGGMGGPMGGAPPGLGGGYGGYGGPAGLF
eukprot:403374259